MTTDWFAGLSPHRWTANRTREHNPAQIYGELFVDVQRRGIFSDQKTFADCVPKGSPDSIRDQYREARSRLHEPDALRAFVLEHFLLPEPFSTRVVAEGATVEGHVHELWEILRREPDVAVKGSSLLPLAHPYVIPGGRFREVYYWDSYFCLLGLLACGRNDLARHMLANCADLLHRYGLIPNGNRTYYLTRSQPPVLALMVELLATIDGDDAYRRYLPALQAELNYWNGIGATDHHVVRLPDGSCLQRYCDEADFPRLEAFAHDEEVARRSPQPPRTLFRHLRSAAESGWDFSSRWFAGGNGLEHTRTTEFVPVDLNCLLLRLEATLARAYRVTHAAERAEQLEAAAGARRQAIARYCWSEAEGFFFDHHAPTQECSPHFTLAGAVPLFVGIASQLQADAVAETLRSRFLQPGGLVTTLAASGEQWDWPNGWAPLQWMAIEGLKRYGHESLAAEIAQRWITLNVAVHARTGRLMEKYNVVDLSLPAGGGEYPTQDGFGWTNGVLIRLLRDYPPPVPPA